MNSMRWAVVGAGAAALLGLLLPAGVLSAPPARRPPARAGKRVPPRRSPARKAANGRKPARPKAGSTRAPAAPPETTPRQPTAPGAAPPGAAVVRVFPARFPEMEAKVLSGINAIRRKHGLGELVADELLTRVARDFSRRMAEEEFFAHTSPTGLNIADMVDASAVPFSMLGENLHESDRVPDPVLHGLEAWMKSPVHRENILEPLYTRTGLGIWRRGEVYYFTQVFLTPL